ncbi:MAG: hypothetical protein H7Y88_06385 [Phycisphaerales bacterium]|nr:hypothetical protein [Phycisphaerales bacterium]
MRIRKKLIFLHTVFSLVLAGILGLAMRPAIREVVRLAEAHEARLVLSQLLASGEPSPIPFAPGVLVSRGDAAAVNLTPGEVGAVRLAGDGIINLDALTEVAKGGARVAAMDSRTGEYVVVEATLAEARSAVRRLYILVTVALLAVYALVAAALELFVLPEHVYGPIRRLLDADRAVQEGHRDRELIPESALPADELGEIMRSRNRSILTIRRQERDLEAALRQLEEVAADLKKKNHLLETARRNLADAGRLASLGMMSAGLAHELNTPLAVLKGLVEKLNSGGGTNGGGGGGHQVTPVEAALMLRVVGRLETLSESLLDFARARHPVTRPSSLAPIVEESWTLVRLDRGRGSGEVRFTNLVSPGLLAECDPDRIGQVLVNLLRNAVDAMADAPAVTSPAIEVAATAIERDGRSWIMLTITDNGPGIHPDVLSRLFEPFVSTNLDSHGTGLGLAVAEGIAREHGGLLLARNRTSAHGAVFEFILPAAAEGASDTRAKSVPRESATPLLAGTLGPTEQAHG